MRSPYYPYSLIDVKDAPPGALVIDPSTGQPFVRPPENGRFNSLSTWAAGRKLMDECGELVGAEEGLAKPRRTMS